MKTSDKESGIKRLAKEMYTAYCQGVGGVAWNGDVLPSWEVFANDGSKSKQVNGWLIAASRAIEYLREDSDSEAAVAERETVAAEREMSKRAETLCTRSRMLKMAAALRAEETVAKEMAITGGG